MPSSPLRASACLDPHCESQMASTRAPATPSTLQALAPNPKQPHPKGEAAARQAPKRSGKQLWKTAAVKVHAYHAVTHQVQHRGAEKVGFGVAEHMLERVVEATLERVSSGAAHGERSVNWLHRAAAKPIKLVQTATCRLRSLGPVGVRCPAPVQVAPPSVAYRAWAGSLTGVKVLLPVAGTALVAHMAHHDLHRAQHERQMHGYSVATLLFYVACLCDALDAVAHALLVLLLLAELVLDDETLLQHHQLHLDHHHMHHLQHEMHHAGMLCAIGATLAVVAGEVLSVRAGAAIANAVAKIQAIKRGNQVRAELALAKKKR